MTQDVQPSHVPWISLHREHLVNLPLVCGIHMQHIHFHYSRFSQSGFIWKTMGVGEKDVGRRVFLFNLDAFQFI